MEEIKNCNNCSYYRQHYIKSRLKFVDTHCGHCTRKISAEGQNALCKPCKQWQPATNKRAEEILTIQARIERMHKQLDEIALFLKNNK